MTRLERKAAITLLFCLLWLLVYAVSVLLEGKRDFWSGLPWGAPRYIEPPLYEKSVP